LLGVGGVAWLGKGFPSPCNSLLVPQGMAQGLSLEHPHGGRAMHGMRLAEWAQVMAVSSGQVALGAMLPEVNENEP